MTTLPLKFSGPADFSAASVPEKRVATTRSSPCLAASALPTTWTFGPSCAAQSASFAGSRVPTHTSCPCFTNPAPRCCPTVPDPMMPTRMWPASRWMHVGCGHNGARGRRTLEAPRIHRLAGGLAAVDSSAPTREARRRHPCPLGIDPLPRQAAGPARRTAAHPPRPRGLPGVGSVLARSAWPPTTSASLPRSPTAGGTVERTRADHASGTDRVAEVAARLPPGVEVVVNVQGDEPLVHPEALRALAGAFEDPLGGDGDARPAARGPRSASNPNVVKAVLDVRSDALYFSRADVPFARDAAPAQRWAHQGLYGYRRDDAPPPGRARADAARARRVARAAPRAGARHPDPLRPDDPREPGRGHARGSRARPRRSSRARSPT